VVPALAARARCVQAHCVRWWAPADEVLPRRRPGAGGAGRADAPAAPRQAQKTTRLCIARDLTEADVVARIMRKENYLIGLLNRGVLALHVPVPGLRKRLMLTKTLEWNLQWCARGRARAARGASPAGRRQSAQRQPRLPQQAARREAGCPRARAPPGARWVSDACRRRSGRVPDAHHGARQAARGGGGAGACWTRCWTRRASASARRSWTTWPACSGASGAAPPARQQRSRPPHWLDSGPA